MQPTLPRFTREGATGNTTETVSRPSPRPGALGFLPRSQRTLADRMAGGNRAVRQQRRETTRRIMQQAESNALRRSFS
jgi:hypothetical protein